MDTKNFSFFIQEATATSKEDQFHLLDISKPFHVVYEIELRE